MLFVYIGFIQYLLIVIYMSCHIDTEKYHESVTVYSGSTVGMSAISCNGRVMFRRSDVIFLLPPHPTNSKTKQRHSY